MKLHTSHAGRAVLLAFGLSVRRCSRADQRSPKPFISKYARRDRKGRHFDPGASIRGLLKELIELYGHVSSCKGEVYHLDITEPRSIQNKLAACTHIITSPPYINAQDYFRNFKLELYLLEGLLPFRVDDIIRRFIGTERGIERHLLADEEAEVRRELVPELRILEKRQQEQALVVHRYLQDMDNAFGTMTSLLKHDGTLVIVCGDNLIGGRRICTWRVLNRMLERRGGKVFDSFGDKILNRAVAPMRCGHKGIVKQEIVSAFRFS